MVEAEAFVKTWQTSENVAAVAKKLKMSERIASSRAVRYRKAGIPLKYMERATARIDRVGLKALALSLAKRAKG